MRLAIAISAALAATAALAGASLSIASIAGVYKNHFRNGTVDGGEYLSENVLEIVELSPTQAYLRAHMEFYNGHLCAFWGVARLEGDALVYRPSWNNDKPCVLSLRRKGDSVLMGDPEDACWANFCGMRGRLEGARFALSSRRPIRYMKRLLASREYGEAIAERDGRK